LFRQVLQGGIDRYGELQAEGSGFGVQEAFPA